MIAKIKKVLLGKNKKIYYKKSEKEKELIRDLLILGHRIDKSLTNKKINKKYESYIEILTKKINELKEINPNNNLIEWASILIKNFDIKKALKVSNTKLKNNDLNFYELAEKRVSCRIWNSTQNDSLLFHAKKAIECAVQSPTSSNRQPWKFIFFNNLELSQFEGLKEKHATSAPFGIFIAMDTRVYLYDDRTDYSIEQLYIDAGAAIMSMIYYLESNSYNTCWNHLGKDLINSREKNIEVYNKLSFKYKIENYMEPVALLVFGEGNDEINLKPPRQNYEYYMIGENNE